MAHKIRKGPTGYECSCGRQWDYDDGDAKCPGEREDAAERKRKSRENQPDAISLPLPAGTRAALERVMQRAGFDDARDFIAWQIHRLDGLPCDQFNEQAIRRVTVTGLDKYVEALG
jgi:hypothetical protein